MKSMPLTDPPPEEPAGTAEAISFVRGLYEHHGDAKALRNYVDGLRPGRLQRIARRIMMDIMKAPQGGAEAGPTPEEPGRAAPGQTTARPRSTARRRPAREP
jgi:hypothetical protein